MLPTINDWSRSPTISNVGTPISLAEARKARAMACSSVNSKEITANCLRDDRRCSQVSSGKRVVPALVDADDGNFPIASYAKASD